MPYWMELHCSVRISGCNNDVQVGVPMAMSRDTSMAAIMQTTSLLSQEGKKLGWVMRDRDWVCPKCLSNTTSK